MKKSKAHSRFRCPMCGMVVWQSAFEKEHLLEMFMQISRGDRSLSFIPVTDDEILKDFIIMIQDRIIDLAEMFGVEVVKPERKSRLFESVDGGLLTHIPKHNNFTLFESRDGGLI